MTSNRLLDTDTDTDTDRQGMACARAHLLRHLSTPTLYVDRRPLCTMKKLLASLRALAGVVGTAQALLKAQMLDPKTILFTTPTLSNDLAPLELVHREPGNADFVFHEEDWSQVEFFPQSQLSEVQRLLKAYKPFECTHRVQHGWREVYMRKIQRVPVLPGVDATHQLEGLLDAKAGVAPMLLSASSVSGSVKNGFSLPLTGNVTLCGYHDAQGISILGCHRRKKSRRLEVDQGIHEAQFQARPDPRRLARSVGSLVRFAFWASRNVATMMTYSLSFVRDGFAAPQLQR